MQEKIWSPNFSHLNLAHKKCGMWLSTRKALGDDEDDVSAFFSELKKCL